MDILANSFSLISDFLTSFFAFFSEANLMDFFKDYAYQPLTMYSFIFLFMLASGFGMPIPEELTLISAGLVCFIGSRPDIYPPPYVGATPVNPYVTAAVAFFSVLFADCLVFTLGKFFGGKILRHRALQRFERRMEEVSRWTQKFGMWAAGAFRFTPGLRFPGHFACGMMGLPMTTFVIIDAIAALISVPTQILLVAFYGEHIFVYLKQFKIALACLAGIVVLYYAFRFWSRRRAEKLAKPLPSVSRSPE